jgi:hypothetical protein
MEELMAYPETPEAAALRLLDIVAFVEGKRIPGTQGSHDADRKWVLDTYTECLRAVTDPHGRG